MQDLDLEKILLELNLSSTNHRIAMKIFSVVSETLKCNFSPSTSNCESNFSTSVKNRRESNFTYPSKRAEQIEDCRNNLLSMIDHFKRIDSKKFKRNFPAWKEARKENIQLLKNTVQSMEKKRTICNIINISSCSVAAAGGIAIIGALLCPPAAAVLGGVALSPFAVGGAVAAGAGGVTSFATNVVDFAQVLIHIEKAKEVCKKDKLNFELLGEWVKQSEELNKVVAELIDLNVAMKIEDNLQKLNKETCRLFSESPKFISVIKGCASIAFREGKLLNQLLLGLGIKVVATILTVFMAMILFHRQSLSILQIHKLGLGMMSGVKAGVEVAKLIAAKGTKGAAAAKFIPRALTKKIILGAAAGVGIAIDVTMIILSSIELANGETCEEGKLILTVTKMLEEEMDVLNDVYQNLS